MKKSRFLALLIILFFISLSGFSQTNTFPSSGSVGIGTTNPVGTLQVMNPSAGFDASNIIYLTNDNTSYGRTNLILTGRLTNGNDAWEFGSSARNSIVFNVNQATDGTNVGSVGTEYYSIQLEGNSKSLGFLSSQNGSSPNLVLLQNGNVGLGTTTPGRRLTVEGDMEILGNSNPINFTNYWQGTTDAVTNTSEISNEVNIYKRLMIVGNRSAGADRRVGIWDRLDVGGAGYYQILNVNGGAYINGNVGIGTTNPENTLTLPNSQYIAWKNAAGTGEAAGITVGTDDAIHIYNNRMGIVVGSNGYVGIGTTNPQSLLSINGTITGKQVTVIQTGWPDFVLNKNYRLKPLSEVKSYLEKNNHLPGIPPAKEIENKGLNLGEMQQKQMQKIEELTLYVIELNKQLQSQNKKIEKLEKELEQVKHK